MWLHIERLHIHVHSSTAAAMHAYITTSVTSHIGTSGFTYIILRWKKCVQLSWFQNISARVLIHKFTIYITIYNIAWFVCVWLSWFQDISARVLIHEFTIYVTLYNDTWPEGLQLSWFQGINVRPLVTDLLCIPVAWQRQTFPTTDQVLEVHSP